MVDLPQPTILDYLFALAIFLLTALPYLNSLEGNMVRSARPWGALPALPCVLPPLTLSLRPPPALSRAHAAAAPVPPASAHSATTCVAPQATQPLPSASPPFPSLARSRRTLPS